MHQVEQIAAALLCNMQVRPTDFTVPRSLTVGQWVSSVEGCMWVVSVCGMVIMISIHMGPLQH